MDSLENAREFFQKDKFATKTTGIVIDAVSEHYAKCSLKITPDHLNAAGSVMGGALFTLADFTFAVASNSPEHLTVSVSSEISYIARAKGDLLIAEAKCIKHGRTTCFYIIEIRDSDGSLVANTTVTGCIVS